jgi:hypothetical protein
MKKIHTRYDFNGHAIANVSVTLHQWYVAAVSSPCKPLALITVDIQA